MKVKAAEDKILLIKEEKESTENGLILPENSIEKVVVKVFDIGEKVDTNLQIGQEVVANYPRSITFERERKTYFSLSKEDIFAVIE